MEWSNTEPARATRNTSKAMLVAAAGRCPSCGKGRLFSRYLKINNQCAHCGEQLHHHRADDAPPYFTIFIVGHLIVPLVLWTERAWRPDIAVHMAIWLPLAIILSLSLLPRVKGAVVGLQWAQYMHGFALSSKCRPHDFDEGGAANDELSKTRTA